MCLAWSCNLAQTSGGGGTDVPDSFQARVIRNDGTSATGATVRIRPQQWSALSGTAAIEWQSRVDSTGRFSIALPDTGSWNLEILDSSSGQGRFLSIRPDSIRKVDAGSIRLSEQGSLQGHLERNTSSFPVLVVLLGTDHAVAPNASGEWSFSGLAPGGYRTGFVYSTAPGSVVLSAIVEVLPADTIVVGGMSTKAGSVAGRIVPSLDWSTNQASIGGWIVSETNSGALDTTDGAGAFQLSQQRGKPIHIVATDPSSGLTVVWDTAFAFDTSLATLPTRVASSAKAKVWKEMRIFGSDGNCRRTRIRVLPDSSGLRTSGNIAKPDTSMAMSGWSDDSGRFALPENEALPCHATAVDPVSGEGATFAWGGDLDSAVKTNIVLGKPLQVGITIHLPPGASEYWDLGYSLSLLGTGISSRSLAMPGERTSIPEVYPGAYRMAVIMKRNGSAPPGRLDFELDSNSPTEIDAVLSQEDLEDTANWPHAETIEVEPIGLTRTLYGVPVRVVLDTIVEWTSNFVTPAYPEGFLSNLEYRFYDETGRWIPHATSYWSLSDKKSEVWIYLDSLAPGHPRKIKFRHGFNDPDVASGYRRTKFVYTRKGGFLACYSNGNPADGSDNQAQTMVRSFGSQSTEGYTELNAWGVTEDGSLKFSIPGTTLGSRFGMQTVFRLDGAGSDTGTLTSFSSPGSTAPFVALKLSGGRFVLRTEVDGIIVESPVGSNMAPRGSWLVSQLRRVDDSIFVTVVDPNSTFRESGSMPVPWPTDEESTTFASGSPNTGIAGYVGRVQSIEIHDGTWTREAAEYSILNWSVTPKQVTVTKLK
jgi:hypothetical protein